MNYYRKVLQNFLDFEGRARRSEYWYFILFHIIILIALSYFAVLTGITFIYTIYNIVLFIPSIAVAVRRMHDVGKSGWYILIPILNLILALSEGTKGANKYGPDPKGISV